MGSTLFKKGIRGPPFAQQNESSSALLAENPPRPEDSHSECLFSGSLLQIYEPSRGGEHGQRVQGNSFERCGVISLAQSMSLAEKRGVANEVMAQLGLSDAADTPVGNWYLRGVSGGQRRRLTLGCELVTGPNLIFLDEPTSGEHRHSVCCCRCRLK